MCGKVASYTNSRENPLTFSNEMAWTMFTHGSLESCRTVRYEGKKGTAILESATYTIPSKMLKHPPHGTFQKVRAHSPWLPIEIKGLSRCGMANRIFPSFSHEGPKV